MAVDDKCTLICRQSKMWISAWLRRVGSTEDQESKIQRKMVRSDDWQS